MSDQTNKKSLVDEIIENARRDRQRLEAVADGLVHGLGQLGDGLQAEGESIDADTSAAFAEEIAKVSDSLSKIQQQLVEIVKIDAKKEIEKATVNPGKMSQKEKDDIYDEMQSDTPDKELMS